MEEEVREILGIKEEEWIYLERGNKDGLIRLYESTNGREWKEGYKECEIENNRVVRLALEGCNLRGKFENETTTTIFTLWIIYYFIHSLKTTNSKLWWKWNKNEGNIPIEIGNLTNLRELKLSTNQLSGSRMRMRMKWVFEDYFIYLWNVKWNERKYSNRNWKSHKFTKIIFE